MFIYGSTLNKVFHDANNYVSMLFDWFRCNELCLNVDKTSYSIFGRNSCELHNNTVVVNSSTLSHVFLCQVFGCYAG